MQHSVEAEMDNSQLKKSAFTGMIWKLAERVGAQFVTLAISIILARLLTPDDYSVVGVVNIFFAFCNIFIIGGFNTALIQKKDADKQDYSSVLWVSLAISFVLYAALFIAAPWIGELYNKPLLGPVFRVMGITLIIDAVKAVVYAYVSNQLQFKKFFFATLVGTLGSAMVGIVMAFNGMGPWALVAQKMISSIADTLVLTFSSKFRVQLKVSLERIKQLFSYGWKIFVSSLISTTYDQLNPLIIGLRFSAVDLSFYTKGQSFPLALNYTLDGALTSVLFPVMSKVQDDKDRVLEYTRKFMRIASYVVFPSMVGFLAVSDSFVRVLLTDKWMPASIYIKLFCITYMFNIIQNGNLQTIRAIGRSDIILKLEILKKSLYFLVIFIAVFVSKTPEWLAAATILNTIIATIINTTPNRKLINYKRRDQFADILPNLILSAIMGAAVYAVNYLTIMPLLKLGLQLVVGAVVYVVLSIVTRNENFYYLLKMLKQYFLKRG